MPRSFLKSPLIRSLVTDNFMGVLSCLSLLPNSITNHLTGDSFFTWLLIRDIPMLHRRDRDYLTKYGSDCDYICNGGVPLCKLYRFRNFYFIRRLYWNFAHRHLWPRDWFQGFMPRCWHTETILFLFFRSKTDILGDSTSKPPHLTILVLCIWGNGYTLLQGAVPTKKTRGSNLFCKGSLFQKLPALQKKTRRGRREKNPLGTVLGVIDVDLIKASHSLSWKNGSYVFCNKSIRGFFNYYKLHVEWLNTTLYMSECTACA